MRKLLLVLIPALIVATAVACSEDEEVAGTTTAPASGSPTAPANGSPSATPTVPASVTATPTEAPSPTPSPTIPPDWATYSDSALGFSLRYPSDLSVTEKGPSDPSQGERDVEFKNQATPPELIVVIAILANSGGLTLDQWVHTYAACLAGSTTEGEVDGNPAIFCISQPLNAHEQAVAFEHAGNVFLIRASESFAGFELLTGSLQVTAQ